MLIHCRLPSAGDVDHWWRAYGAARLPTTSLLAIPALCKAPSPTQDGGRQSDGISTSAGLREQPRIRDRSLFPSRKFLIIYILVLDVYTVRVRFRCVCGWNFFFLSIISRWCDDVIPCSIHSYNPRTQCLYTSIYLHFIKYN